jgi:hypothetical protein
LGKTNWFLYELSGSWSRKKGGEEVEIRERLAERWGAGWLSHAKRKKSEQKLRALGMTSRVVKHFSERNFFSFLSHFFSALS